MLAAEKHKATFIAVRIVHNITPRHELTNRIKPIGIGLVLFVCQLLGTLWTG